MGKYSLSERARNIRSSSFPFAGLAKHRRRIPLRRVGIDVLFLLPALLIFTAFVIYPIASSFYFSLTDWNGLDQTANFVGLANFAQLFTDVTVWQDIQHTLVFAFFVMIAQNGIALILALCLDSFLRALTFLRVFFLIPAMISGLAVSYIWSYLYSPLFGFINNTLSAIGLSKWTQDWLGDPHYALSSIIATNTWQWVGFSMVIFLAGLQAVPQELYEAASIDGAGSWPRFHAITFPLIAPAFTVNMLLTVIGSLKVFDLIFVMTEGGPGNATESLAMRVYKEAFTLNHFGYATAIGIVMSLGILFISVTGLIFLRKREVEL